MATFKFLVHFLDVLAPFSVQTFANYYENKWLLLLLQNFQGLTDTLSAIADKSIPQMYLCCPCSIVHSTTTKFYPFLVLINVCNDYS